MQYQILISASLLQVSSLLRGVCAVPVQLSERIKVFLTQMMQNFGSGGTV